jgi:PKD repeat protein
MSRDTDEGADDGGNKLHPSVLRRSVLKALALGGTTGGTTLSASEIASALRGTADPSDLGRWRIVGNHLTVDSQADDQLSHVNAVTRSMGLSHANVIVPDPEDVVGKECENGPGIQHRFVVAGFSIGERSRLWDPESGAFTRETEGLTVHNGSTVEVRTEDDYCGNVGFSLNSAFQAGVPRGHVTDDDQIRRIGRKQVDEAVDRHFENDPPDEISDPQIPQKKFPWQMALDLAVDTSLSMAAGALIGGPLGVVVGFAAVGMTNLMRETMRCSATETEALENDGVRLVQSNFDCPGTDDWERGEVLFHVVDLTVTLPPGESGTVVVDQAFDYMNISRKQSDVWGLENDLDDRSLDEPGDFIHDEHTWTISLPALDYSDDPRSLDEEDLPSVEEAEYGPRDGPEPEIHCPSEVQIDGSDEEVTFTADAGVGFDFDDEDTLARWQISTKGIEPPIPRFGYGEEHTAEFLSGDSIQRGLGGNASGDGECGNQARLVPLGPGDYEVELVLVDEHGRTGVASDEFTVTSSNQGINAETELRRKDGRRELPADEGDVFQGETLVLDGRDSEDLDQEYDDSDGIELFEWRIFPPGRTTDPVILYGPKVEYEFDQSGVYVVELGVYSVYNGANLSNTPDEIPPTSEPPDAFVRELKDYTGCGSGDHGAADFEIRSFAVESNGAPNPDIWMTPTDPDVSDPQTGDEILFEGEGSSDDGEIRAYRWTLRYLDRPRGRIPADDDFEWDFEGHQFTRALDSAGEYEVELTVIDDDGRRASTERTFTLEDGSVLDVGIRGPDEVRVGKNEEFILEVDENLDPGTDLDVEWSGDVTGEDRVISTRFETAGEKTIRVNAETPEQSAEIWKTVTATDAPSVTLSGREDVEIGESVEFDADASDPDGGPLDYYWTIGDGDGGGLDQGSTVTHTFDEPGEYTVEVTVVDDENEETTRGLDVSVGDPPEIEFESRPSSITVGDYATFEVSVEDPDGNGVSSVEWSFGDGDERTGTRVRKVFNNADEYEVTVTATDADGQRSRDSFVVEANVASAPEIDLDGPSNPVVGETEIYYARTADFGHGTEIDEYRWDFGDGTTETTGTYAANHAFEETGEYTVEVTAVVESDVGEEKTSSDELEVTVSTDGVGPVVTITDSPDEIAVGRPAAFEAAKVHPSGDDVTFVWEFGDGEQRSGTGPDTSHVYREPGSYTVTVTGTDADGDTDSATASVEVVETTEPTVEVDGPRTVPLNESVTFEADATDPDGGGIREYNWTVEGEFQTTEESTYTHDFESEGEYTLTVTVVDDDYETAAAELPVTVVDRRPPRVNITGTPDDPATGREASFIATAEDPDHEGFERIEWALGDGASATGWLATHIYTDPGEYTVTVTVEDLDGNVADDSVTIRVEEAGRPPTVSFDVEADPVYSGSVVELTATATDPEDDGIDRIEWEFEDDTTAMGDRVSHVFEEPGEQEVMVKAVARDGDVGVAQRPVTVEDGRPSVSVSGPSSATVDESVEFTATASDPDGSEVVGYEWTFGDGSSLETDDGTATHSYEDPGEYEVTLVVEDDEGDTRSDTHRLEVEPDDAEPSVDIDAPEEVDAGERIEFEAVVSLPDDEVAEYTWIGNDYVLGKGPTFAESLSRSGTYSVRLVVETESGAELTATHEFEVVGPDKLSASIWFDTSGVNPPRVLVGEGVPIGVSTRPGDREIEQVEWDFGNGDSATGETPPFQGYDAAGRYEITVTVTDVDGNTAEDTREIVVDRPAPPEATLDGPDEVPTEQSFELDADVPNSPNETYVDRYVWSFEDGTTRETDRGRIEYTYDEPGTYEVTVEVVNTVGERESATHTVTVEGPNRGPTVTLDGPSIVEEGELAVVTADAEDPDGEIVSYDWRRVVDSDGDTARILGPPEGVTREVSVTVTDDDGASATAEHTVESPGGDDPEPDPNEPPTVTIDAPDALEPGETATATARARDPDGSILDYDWSNVESESEATATIAVPSGRTETTVSVTVTDDDGATATAEHTVERVDMDVFLEGPGSVQRGDSASFEGSVSMTGDASTVAYRWDFGDGTTETTTGAMVEHTYDAAGEYAVTLEVENDRGMTATARTTVKVTVPFSVAVDAPEFGGVGEGVRFVARATEGTTKSVNWQFDDGTEARSKTNATSHVYESTGTYTVVAEATSVTGKTDTATHEITILSDPT